MALKVFSGAKPAAPRCPIIFILLVYNRIKAKGDKIMADFNVVLTPGDAAAGLVNTVVEIPEGSRLKLSGTASAPYLCWTA